MTRACARYGKARPIALRRKYVMGELPACISCPWKIAYVPGTLQSRIADREGKNPQLYRGWHDPDGAGTVWSEREAIVVLGGAPLATGIRLSGALPPSADGEENSLEVFCNGTRLGTIVNPVDALISFDACFGGIRETTGTLTFTLRTQKVFRPGRMGVPGDSRALGFALHRIELTS
jgi:hypothetical protein